MEGNGHVPAEPVRLNLLVRDFVDRCASAATCARRTWTRALARPKRALYLSVTDRTGSCPPGLAMADDLREAPAGPRGRLAHPASRRRAARARGERVHPAAAQLANESAHFEGESAEHDLHAFHALRNMDEISCTTSASSTTCSQSEAYDVVIGDEAWDVDFFLHENPELKHTSFVWMTDFVGMLPMPDGGEREAFLTSEYNTEMIEQVDRFRRIRDRSIYVGDPSDLVPDPLGPGLPGVREWTEANFDFAGYVTGFDPVDETLRRRLARVVRLAARRAGLRGQRRRHRGRPPVAAQGHRLVPAGPASVPGLRMVVVAGPRIDPATLVGDDLPQGSRCGRSSPTSTGTWRRVTSASCRAD